MTLPIPGELSDRADALKKAASYFAYQANSIRKRMAENGATEYGLIEVEVLSACAAGLLAMNSPDWVWPPEIGGQK